MHWVAPVYAGQIFNPASTVAVGSNYVRTPFPGNIIPTSQLDPSSLLFLTKLYPTPNYGNGRLPNYIWTQGQSINNDQFGFRVDQRFSNNDILYGRYNQTDSTQVSPGSLPSDPVDQFNGAKSWMVSYTHLFNPTTIFNAQMGYLRTRIPISPLPIGADLANQLGFAPSIKDALAFPDKNTYHRAKRLYLPVNHRLPSIWMGALKSRL